MSISTENKGKFLVCLTNSQTASDWKEYTAKSIQITYESLASSDSGRTDDGEMHISWVLNKIRKFQITMPPLNEAEIDSDSTNPLRLVQGREYWIKIWDIVTNSQETIHVYTSNSQAECYSGVLYNGLWQGIQFSAIEMKGIKY